MNCWRFWWINRLGWKLTERLSEVLSQAQSNSAAFETQPQFPCVDTKSALIQPSMPR